MKFSTLAFLLLFMPQFAFSQLGYAYFEHYNNGMSEQYKKNNTKALEEYTKAFKLKLGDVTHYMNALALAIECKDTASIKTIIEYGAIRGLTKSDVKIVYHYFRKQKPNTDINLTKELALLNRQRSEIHENKQLKREIKRLIKKDQRIHTKKVKPDVIENTQMVDSINAIKLKEIITDLGRLPLYDELKNDSHVDLCVLLMHMSVKDLSFFMPFILKAIKKGDFNYGDDIAFTVDVESIANKSVYCFDKYGVIKEVTNEALKKNSDDFIYTSLGVFSRYNKTDRCRYFYPTSPDLSAQLINNMRYLLGLDSVENYHKRTNIKSITVDEFKKLK